MPYLVAPGGPRGGCPHKRVKGDSMKRFLAVLILAGVGSAVALAQEGDAPKEAPQEAPAGEGEAPTVKQQASYIVGYRIGQRYLEQGAKFDTEEFARGMADAFAEKALAVDEETERTVMEQFSQEAMAEVSKRGEARKAAGAKWLAENKTKEGVKTTASGLQYRVVREGQGAHPTAASTVRVHYRGTLTDGSEFDSSYSRGEPTEFPLGRVIPGWTEGIQLMTPGAKYVFYIPSELAYGESSPTPKIPPHSVLVFEVELLEIK